GGGDDRLHQPAGGGAEGDFGDAQVAFFLGGDAGADPDFATAQDVAVVRRVHDAGSGEIGNQGERLVTQDGDGGFDEFVEIVRQDLARKSDGDALDALGEQERKFDR